MNRRGGVWVVVQFALLVLLAFAPQIGPAWPKLGIVVFAGWLAMVCSVALFVWSKVTLGSSFTPFPRPIENGELVTSGAYGLIRHPMYLAAIIGPFGLAIATSNWSRLAITVALIIFFDVKSRREERWLVEVYPGYALYKSRVKRIIPFIY